MKKKLLLLAVTMLLLFFSGEIIIRIYAAWTDTFIAPNYEEFAKRRFYDELVIKDISLDERFMYHSLLGKVPKPNTRRVYDFNKTTNTGQKTYRIWLDYINAEGMRSFTEINKTKNEKVRIAILGDSFTWGDDVETIHSYPSILELLIPHAEILNFGRGGAGLSYMYLTFKNRTKDYEPDVVIMSLFIEDLARDLKSPFNPFLKIVDGKLEGEPPLPATHDFLKIYTPPRIESYFLNFIRSKIEQIGRTKRAYAYGMKLLPLVLQDIKNEMGKKLFLVVLFRKPVDDDPMRAVTTSYYQKIKELLDEMKIPYLDGDHVFHEEYPTYGKNESVFFLQGGHFNPLGNGVFAQAIATKLNNIGVINKTENCGFIVSEIVIRTEEKQKGILATLSCISPHGEGWTMSNYEIINGLPLQNSTSHQQEYISSVGR